MREKGPPFGESPGSMYAESGATEANNEMVRVWREKDARCRIPCLTGISEKTSSYMRTNNSIKYDGYNKLVRD